MKARRCVWTVCLVLLLTSCCECACQTDGTLTVCPHPIIVYPDQSITLQIICSARTVPGSLQQIKISRQKSVEDPLVYNLYNATSKTLGFVVPANRISAFNNRSQYFGNATFLTVTVSPAEVEDLLITYVCQVTSVTGNLSPTNVSAVEVTAGAYPGNVSLSSSPTRVVRNESLLPLHCQGEVSGLSGYSRLSLAEHVFQYYDSGHRWTTLNQSGPFSRGVELGPVEEGDGVFFTRVYTLKLLVTFIPKCCLKFRCYLSVHGHEFEDLAAEHEACLSAGEGNCPRRKSASVKGSADFLIPLLVGLALAAFLPLIALVCFRRHKRRKRKTSSLRRRSSSRSASLPHHVAFTPNTSKTSSTATIRRHELSSTTDPSQSSQSARTSRSTSRMQPSEIQPTESSRY